MSSSNKDAQIELNVYVVEFDVYVIEFDAYVIIFQTSYQSF